MDRELIKGKYYGMGTRIKDGQLFTKVCAFKSTSYSLQVQYFPSRMSTRHQGCHLMERQNENELIIIGSNCRSLHDVRMKEGVMLHQTMYHLVEAALQTRVKAYGLERE